MWATIWALIPKKIPKFLSSPAQRLLHPCPGLGSWRGTTPRAAAPKGQARPSPFLLPAASDRDPWHLPRGLSWEFSWEFSRAGSREAAQAVGNLGLQQPWVWGVSSSLTSGQFSLVQPEPGLILWGCSYPDLLPAALLPWQLMAPWHSFWSVPLDKGDTQRGEKLQQWLRE